MLDPYLCRGDHPQIDQGACSIKKPSPDKTESNIGCLWERKIILTKDKGNYHHMFGQINVHSMKQYYK